MGPMLPPQGHGENQTGHPVTGKHWSPVSPQNVGVLLGAPGPGPCGVTARQDRSHHPRMKLRDLLGPTVASGNTSQSQPVASRASGPASHMQVGCWKARGPARTGDTRTHSGTQGPALSALARRTVLHIPASQPQTHAPLGPGRAGDWRMRGESSVQLQPSVPYCAKSLISKRKVRNPDFM